MKVPTPARKKFVDARSELQSNLLKLEEFKKSKSFDKLDQVYREKVDLQINCMKKCMTALDFKIKRINNS